MVWSFQVCSNLIDSWQSETNKERQQQYSQQLSSQHTDHDPGDSVVFMMTTCSNTLKQGQDGRSLSHFDYSFEANF